MWCGLVEHYGMSIADADSMTPRRYWMLATDRILASRRLEQKRLEDAPVGSDVGREYRLAKLVALKKKQEGANDGRR